MTRSDAPEIRVVDPHARFGTWSAFIIEAGRATSPMIRFGARFAALVDKQYMSPQGCLIYVARRVGEAKLAHARTSWFGGRMFNRATGSDPDFVPLSGAVVANALTWLGEDLPEDFPRGADLELRFDVAEKLDADLRAKAEVEWSQN